MLFLAWGNREFSYQVGKLNEFKFKWKVTILG